MADLERERTTVGLVQGAGRRARPQGQADRGGAGQAPELPAPRAAVRALVHRAAATARSRSTATRIEVARRRRDRRAVRRRAPHREHRVGATRVRRGAARRATSARTTSSGSKTTSAASATRDARSEREQFLVEAADLAARSTRWISRIQWPTRPLGSVRRIGSVLAGVITDSIFSPSKFSCGNSPTRCPQWKLP